MPHFDEYTGHWEKEHWHKQRCIAQSNKWTGEQYNFAGFIVLIIYNNEPVEMYVL